MYCYKKTDKNFKNPILYRDAVKFKTLYNKAEKILNLMTELKETLMFEGEEHETKVELYKAMDSMQNFQDNLKLKNNIKVEE